MCAAKDASATWGAGIAGKLSDHVTRSVLSARELSAGLTTRVAMDVQDQFFRLTGAEVRKTIGPLWAEIADHEDAPMWAKQTANFVARGQGQWQTMLASTATGAAMGGGILSLVTNYLQPTIGSLIRRTPNTPLSPSDAATATALGLSWGPDLWNDAGQAGINRDRFNLMVDLARPQLPVGDLLRMWQLGEISEQTLTALLHRQGYIDSYIRLLKQSVNTIPSMSDAAAMWSRSAITDDQLKTIGRKNGYPDSAINAYAELAGQPPAPEVLYSAYRRGLIDSNRLRRGIVQGPIRNEWFDVIEALQYHSMTPEEAANAVTQGHMDLSRGQAIAKEYGLNPQDFATIVETSGLPPGIEFAREAYDRGFISDGEYDTMFLESRIKNRYLPLLKRMRTKLLPQETARSLLAKGVITAQQCAQVLHGHGFSDDDVQALIEGSLTDKTSSTRELSMSQVSSLYAEREITHDTALSWLAALNYSEAEAQWILTLADLSRSRTFRNAIIGRVRSAFVRGLIDENRASLNLDKLQIPPDRRADLLQLWAIERETVTKDLTPSQIVLAAAKGLMSVQSALDRLIGQGYASQDASVLLQLSGVGTPA